MITYTHIFLTEPKNNYTRLSVVSFETKKVKKSSRKTMEAINLLGRNNVPTTPKNKTIVNCSSTIRNSLKMLHRKCHRNQSLPSRIRISHDDLMFTITGINDNTI